MGSFHFGKYPWEVATWEKSFGKVPNIEKMYMPRKRTVLKR